MPDQNAVARQGSWAEICRQAASHSQIMAGMSVPQFRGFFSTPTQKLLALAPPNSDDELHLRFRQSAALASVIGQLGHVDGMARLTPAALPELIIEAERFSQADFLSNPDQQHSESAAFSLRVLRICNSK
jgi:hypothetical protein